MKSGKSELILFIFVVILLFQAYLVIFKEEKNPLPPLENQSGGFGEGKTLAQSYPQYGGFGEGQSPPPPPPFLVAPPHEYRYLLIGILLLEKDPAYALSPQQAKELLALINQDEELKNVIPEMRKTILAALSSFQKEFIRDLLKYQPTDNPPDPREMKLLMAKVIAALKERN